MTPLACVCGEVPTVAGVTAQCRCGRRYSWRFGEERWYVLEPETPAVGWVPLPTTVRRA